MRTRTGVGVGVLVSLLCIAVRVLAKLPTLMQPTPVPRDRAWLVCEIAALATLEPLVETWDLVAQAGDPEELCTAIGDPDASLLSAREKHVSCGRPMVEDLSYVLSGARQITCVLDSWEEASVSLHEYCDSFEQQALYGAYGSYEEGRDCYFEALELLREYSAKLGLSEP